MPTFTSTVSSTRTSFDGFAPWPLICTRPPTTASVAALRVLKNRAAQSHLSILHLAHASSAIHHHHPPEPRRGALAGPFARAARAEKGWAQHSEGGHVPESDA